MTATGIWFVVETELRTSRRYYAATSPTHLYDVCSKHGVAGATRIDIFANSYGICIYAFVQLHRT